MKPQINIGATYRFKRKGSSIDVKVINIYEVTTGKRTSTRYSLLNLSTNREITAKSSRNFLYKIDEMKGF